MGTSSRDSDGRRGRAPGSRGRDVAAGPRWAPTESPLARAPTAALGQEGAGSAPGRLPEVVRGPSSAPAGRPEVPKDAHGRPAFGPVTRFGDYTLIKKLATGGMAEIWLARQTGITGFARFLVVKKILPHLAEQPTFVNMFTDEAKTSFHLSHPNIVQIFDLGKAQGTLYIAMEYIAGENLAAIAWRGMKRGRPFPTSYAARVIADACKALHYAHNSTGNDGQPLDIVHRDVSPQNVLVTYDGAVKVVDFGIAKAATKTEHTKTGMLKGKFSYMSPEQCLGVDVDRRSDIFALGILLYELCTGKRLYKHESELMILDMITKRSVVPPSRVSPDIPPELEAIILRALEKDVQLRFQTAQEMQIALEDHLRTLRSPPHEAEISAYMHALFADKIAEKRRLRERASRDDFEAMFLDEEATESAPDRRRVVHGGSPNQIVVHPAPPGTGAAFTPSSPAYTETPLVDHRAGPTWTTRVLLVAGLVLLGVAGTFVYARVTGDETIPSTRFEPGPPAPPPPVVTGKVTLESSPNQATIHLDGEPMKLADGTLAKTPSDLSGLQYGETYRVTLEKEGYESHVVDIEMGEETDGETFDPILEPLPGHLVTEVRGWGASQVHIRYDGEEVGSGPRVSKQVPGNTTVLVEASRPGRRCRVKPSRVRVVPNETVTAQVRCRIPRTRKPRETPRGASAAGPAADARPRSAPERRRPRPKPRPEGCTTNADLPKGHVTIATRPYSTVYWGDRKLGQTPLNSVRLPAGCVQLRAVTDEGQSRTVKIEVKPNMVSKYKFNIGG